MQGNIDMNNKEGGKKLADGVVWDLTRLYSGINDPKIKKHMKKVEELVDDFVAKYKGNINSKDLTAKFLLDFIKDGEEINYLLSKLGLYAGLLYSKNVTSEKVSAFHQKISEFGSKINSLLVWSDVEWLRLDNTTADHLIEDDLLKDYRHSLKHSRVLKPYILSEKEEILLTKTSLSGPYAFTRLFELINTDARYVFEIGGKEKELSFSELVVYLTKHKDRQVRENASMSLTDGLKKNSKLYTFILNTLLLDSKIEDDIRGFDYPQHATFLSDEVEPEMVEVMSSSIKSFYPIVERFYKLKSKLLGFKNLYEWDRYSGIYTDIEKEYSWSDAKDIVLGSFEKFNKNFASVGRKFFDKGWIDAPIKDGKKSGAFCSFSNPRHHPYLFLNFKGGSNDIMTLAHELGHGIHFCLSEDLPLSECHPSIPVAEIASVFAEMLVFDFMYKNTNDKRLKINLLADKLQNSFATVFRQNAFYLFEENIHKHRREKGELSVEDFNNYYQSELQKMFGEGLTLTKNHQYWWMYVSHFYNYDFYVYSYAFGELLTLALYSLSKEDEDFAKKYIDILKLGGSKSPVQITESIGVDVKDSNFWLQGLNILSDYVDEFESLFS